MAEWSNAAVLKTVDLKGFGGSNPSLSAKPMQIASAFLFREGFEHAAQCEALGVFCL